MKDCHRIGEIVTFRRCGELQRAEIVGWAPLGFRTRQGFISGADLDDPRYAAISARNRMRVDVCESEIVA